MTGLFMGLMLVSATPMTNPIASATASIYRVTQQIPVLAPRNDGGGTSDVIAWLLNYLLG